MASANQTSDNTTTETVAVVGAGSIGAAFAVVFASAGLQVSLFDTEKESLKRACVYIEQSLAALHEHGLLESAVPRVLARIQYHEDLAEAVAHASWVHECVPERVELKIELFQRLDELLAADVILASASSAIPASRFASDLSHPERCLVAHPGNPPFLLRVLELVPAPFTAASIVERARVFSERIGLDPIIVNQEVEGFVYNRLQGAMLREAYCLVRDGVASVEDIDTLVRRGLGLRWSVVGPFETVDLNTRGGIQSHAEKLGPAYARMGAERGQDDPWTVDLVENVTRQRRERLPLEQWEERVSWRDRMLMRRLSQQNDAE